MEYSRGIPCFCNDLSRLVVENGACWVQAWEGSEVIHVHVSTILLFDLKLYGRFEESCDV